MFCTNHKQDALKNLMSLNYLFEPGTVPPKDVSVYGEHAILHIMENDKVEESMAILKYTADWFEHPHPRGRDPKGEADFAAIRLVCALYEPVCYDKLTEDVKASIKHFFLEHDYRSVYGSENHALMFRAARFLAAQFYEGEEFVSYGLTAQECYVQDMEYLHEFMDFRARRGWGEFDSLGYGREIVLILATLHKYAADERMRRKCHMALDVVLLDMIADSLGELYAGAHGRSYPNAVLDRTEAGMVKLYRYYFGGRFYDGTEINSVNIYLSDYVPSPIVYEIVQNKKVPYENREKKNLHLMSAWKEEIDKEALSKEQGSINKYTYVCEDYAIGSVNCQEDYNPLIIEKDRLYARHQQHEWELTLPGGGEHKIFSHHCGLADEHKINNRWTGDNRCCCGSYYTNHNTAIAMYNIDNRDKLPLINAFVPLEIFREKLLEEKYVFLAYEKLYIALYFDNGYRVNHEDEFENKELLSDGWQNAVVCRVEYQDKFDSLNAFAEHIRSLPVVFDRKLRTVTFDGIKVYRGGNSENGVENQYPYTKTYDCPFLQSEWDSGVIEVICGEKKIVYDFVRTMCEMV